MKWLGIDTRTFLTAAIFVFILFAIHGATKADAATLDEIFIMSGAGIPTDIIIEVVEATGLDDELDEDAILELVDADLDPLLLEYLLTYLPDYDEYDLMENPDLYDGNNLSNHPNWAGGSGFSHGGTGYNPLNDRSDPNVYWEGPAYSDSYYRDQYDNYYYPRNMDVVIYEPPVYQLYSNPYRAYPIPRYYNYSQGYWYDGQYVIYDGDFHRNHNYCNDPWYRDRYYDYYWGDDRYRNPYGWRGSIGGSWSHENGRSSWNSWGNAWYRGDRVNLRIRF